MLLIIFLNLYSGLVTEYLSIVLSKVKGLNTFSTTNQMSLL